MMLSNFNDGNRNRNRISPPINRPIRHVIQDLNDDRIYTKTSFGRKPQWKNEHKKKFIETLLEGNVPVDSISISHVGNSDRCINGNNRMRAILSFSRNEFGVDVLDGSEDKRVYTYYYSDVPEIERNNPRRNRFCKVLPSAIKDTFDQYPINMNIRYGLTEKEEVDWYKNMNKNIMPHKKGHILLTQLCHPEDEEKPFVDSLFSNFPQLKSRLSIPSSSEDDNSVGFTLVDLFDVGFEVIDVDGHDKNEETLKAIACIHNLVSTGKTYDGEFQGDFNLARMQDNYAKLMNVFEGIEFSENTLNYFKESCSAQKKFLPKIWSPSFLLGPVAWSIANNKENAIEVWKRFIQNCSKELIELTYIEGDETTCDELTKRRKQSDSSLTKYSTAWEKVLQWYNVNR